MRIEVKPTGKVIKGHVLDCSVGPLVERLRDIDPLLYVAWNPKKLRGWGVWEVRRKSEEKTVRMPREWEIPGKGKIGIPGDVTSFGGMTIVYPKYHEIDLVNHVLDVPFLNYGVLEKIKAMDSWEMKDMGYKGKNFVKQAEYLEAKHLEKIEDKAIEELEYGLKQIKGEVRDLQEFVASGGNPYRLADHWK